MPTCSFSPSQQTCRQMGRTGRRSGRLHPRSPSSPFRASRSSFGVRHGNSYKSRRRRRLSRRLSCHRCRSRSAAAAKRSSRLAAFFAYLTAGSLTKKDPAARACGRMIDNHLFLAQNINHGENNWSCGRGRRRAHDKRKGCPARHI